MSTPAAICRSARASKPSSTAPPSDPSAAPRAAWDNSFPARKPATGTTSSVRVGARHGTVPPAGTGAGWPCRRRATAPARSPPCTAAQEAPPASRPVRKTAHKLTGGAPGTETTSDETVPCEMTSSSIGADGGRADQTGLGSKSGAPKARGADVQTS